MKAVMDVLVSLAMTGVTVPVLVLYIEGYFEGLLVRAVDGLAGMVVGKKGLDEADDY